jgi:hypothetical protein
MDWRGIWEKRGKEIKISLYMPNKMGNSLLNFELDFHRSSRI